MGKHMTEKENLRHRVFFTARQSLKHHASGGNVLIAATVLALIIANISAINQFYFNFWTQTIHLQLGDFNIFSHGGEPMTLIEFINDALMAIFFFTIGLEIKREILVGELSSFKKALLPIVAAIGGMIIPAATYMLLSNGSDYSNGFAIPMSTDIAFSLGILALLGSRVPLSLKIFLTTLAVVDDIGGIIMIAAFYSSHINYLFILYACLLLVVLFFGGHLQIQSKAFYFIVGGIVWFLFLNSGIHPTIAGVLVAFAIPSTPVFAPKKYVKSIRNAISNFNAEDDELLSKRTILNKDQMNWLKEVESASDKVISPLQDLEDTLHPLVNYFIIPLFAFANAGIFLMDMDPATIVEGVSLAIIAGLFIGKFVGILGFSWLAVKFNLAPMPENCNWKMIASIAMLGGVGFTVSLFIANLSFGSPEMIDLLNHAKLGIVVASLLSGIAASVALHKTLPPAGSAYGDGGDDN